MSAWRPTRSREVLTFLAVGGLGYVVDVAVFNLLLSGPAPLLREPKLAKVTSVAAAMVVTYLGNRYLTWPTTGHRRSHEVALFMFFNFVGMAISVVVLAISHDLLGLTSRLADNISANVIGLLLGTAFRYWSYRRFVFGARAASTVDHQVGGDLVLSDTQSGRHGSETT